MVLQINPILSGSFSGEQTIKMYISLAVIEKEMCRFYGVNLIDDKDDKDDMDDKDDKDGDRQSRQARSRSGWQQPLEPREDPAPECFKITFMMC